MAKSFTGYHQLSGSPKVPRVLYAPARSLRLCLRHGTQTQRPHPVDETGSRRWQRRRGAARGRNSRAEVGAVVCLLRERGDARSKSRVPQPGAALQFSQGHSCPQRKLAKRKRDSLGTIHFPDLPRFRGAVSLRLIRYVYACGTVRCKPSQDPFSDLRKSSINKNPRPCGKQKRRFCTYGAFLYAESSTTE